MAEGLARKYLNNYIIKSAGTYPETVNPLAIEVMSEIDIDLSSYQSKSISDKEIESFDIVITLCGDAKDKCPNLNNLVKKHIHWDISDPAKTSGSKQSKLNVFRNTRDQIKDKIKVL